MFVTSEGHPGARLQRALAVGNLTAAEQAAFEVAFIPLEQARALVELYAEKGDRKYERAALKYLRRYLDESEPSLVDVAQLAGVLAERALLHARALSGPRETPNVIARRLSPWLTWPAGNAVTILRWRLDDRCGRVLNGQRFRDHTETTPQPHFAASRERRPRNHAGLRMVTRLLSSSAGSAGFETRQRAAPSPHRARSFASCILALVVASSGRLRSTAHDEGGSQCTRWLPGARFRISTRRGHS